MNGPLALPTLPGALTPANTREESLALNGSSAAIQTASGSVAAIFVFDGHDRHLNVATYTLQITNASHIALICRIWAIACTGEAQLAYPLTTKIEPCSIKSTSIAVRMDAFDSFERAIAEIVGDGVRCTVEAPAPVLRRSKRLYRAIAMAAFAVVSVAAAALGLGASVPKIGAFAAPPSAASGTSVQAEYSSSGIGTLTYDVTGPDGQRLAGGRLADRSGTIDVALLSSLGAGVYSIHMHMSGPFGADDEQRVVRALPSRLTRVPSAAIAALSVVPVVAKAGASVTVYYRASGTSGELQLIDETGNVWSHGAFSRTGETTLVIPPFSKDRELQMVLRVQRGASVAQSRAGLLISAAPSAGAAAKTSTQPAGVNAAAAPDSAADNFANGTFQVETPSVKSGGTIHVRILSPRNGMRVSLTDTQSHEITGVNVGVDQDSVALRAPAVSLATRYIVVAAFTDGFGQESIVQPVTVRP